MWFVYIIYILRCIEPFSSLMNHNVLYVAQVNTAFILQEGLYEFIFSSVMYPLALIMDWWLKHGASPLFLLLRVPFFACSQGATARYQLGTISHLGGWCLAPVRPSVAAVALSTCWDIVLPEECSTHRTRYNIVMLHVVHATFPRGESLGA